MVPNFMKFLDEAKANTCKLGLCNPGCQNGLVSNVRWMECPCSACRVQPSGLVSNPSL
jgi:hypothetical protein